MKQFREKVQQQFNKMSESGLLFRSEMTGQEVWELYLGSFLDGQDPKFRDPESTVHNCNHCKNFIRRYGNIVCLSPTPELEVTTIFDVEIEGEYENVSKALSSALKGAKIANIFTETFDELNSLPYESCTKHNLQFKLGVDVNHKRYTKEEAELYPGIVKEGEIRKFEHLSLIVPSAFVDTSGSSVEALMSIPRDAKNVFQRGMREIPLATLELVRDLISQGSLLNGDTHLSKVTTMVSMKEDYDAMIVSNSAIEDEECHC